MSVGRVAGGRRWDGVARLRRPSPARGRRAGGGGVAAGRWWDGGGGAELDGGGPGGPSKGRRKPAGGWRPVDGAVAAGEPTAARCANAFLSWPGNPLEFNTSPGSEGKKPRKQHRRPADVAQLVEHHLAKVRVASSNLVVRSNVGDLPDPLQTPGGVAERRGNGLQSRLHGFKSRLHLQGRLAQRESASLTRKRSLVQSQYRPLDPHGSPARLAQRESASLTRKRSLVQSQYRARNTARPAASHHAKKVPARLAQRESASLTRKRSLVQSQYRAPPGSPGRPDRPGLLRCPGPCACPTGSSGRWVGGGTGTRPAAGGLRQARHVVEGRPRGPVPQEENSSRPKPLLWWPWCPW